MLRIKSRRKRYEACDDQFEKCIFQHRFSIEKCDSLLLRLKIRRIFTENSLYSLDEGE